MREINNNQKERERERERHSIKRERSRILMKKRENVLVNVCERDGYNVCVLERKRERE